MFFGKRQNMHHVTHVNLCPFCTGRLPALETTKAASRKGFAAEMQRHVLPLIRDTKT